MNLCDARKSPLLLLVLLAGCGGSDKAEVSAHQTDTLRVMERQVGDDLEKQLSETYGHTTVRKVDCADVSDKKARCIAVAEGQRVGIDVNIASDGSFLWEVRP